MAEIRAGFCRVLLAALDEAGVGEAVRAAVGAAGVRAVEEAPATELIDAAPYHAMVEAAHRLLDADAFLAVSRALPVRFRRSPAMAKALDVLLRLTAATPHSVYQHFGRLREATVRDYGTLRYERLSALSAAFVLDDHPPSLMTDASAVVFRGSLLAGLDATGYCGDVVVTHEDRARGHARLVATWRPRDAGAPVATL